MVGSIVFEVSSERYLRTLQHLGSSAIRKVQHYVAAEWQDGVNTNILASISKQKKKQSFYFSYITVDDSGK
jgi:hypothetical protein